MSVAFLFPGQGSQVPTSGVPWRETEQWALVAAAAETADRDIGHLLLTADAAELLDTANAQLSTFVISAVAAAATIAAGVVPDHVAGHSLGEYTALTAAGVLSIEAGSRLVAARGDAMRTASHDHPGTMAAIIGLDVEAVEAVCDEIDGDVWVANDNAPGQVVIAGDPAAIDAAGALARDRGARRPMPLQVSGAFHTLYMAAAQAPLDTALAATDLRPPTATPWANVTASAERDPLEWRGLLSSQLCSKVRWREEIAEMATAGVDTFVEVGPGTVLSGMVKRIAPEARRFQVATPDDMAALVQNLR